jgi:hypothetical protein
MVLFLNIYLENRFRPTVRVRMPALYHITKPLGAGARPRPNMNVTNHYYIRHERYRARIVIRLGYWSKEPDVTL